MRIWHDIGYCWGVLKWSSSRLSKHGAHLTRAVGCTLTRACVREFRTDSLNLMKSGDACLQDVANAKDE